MAERILTFVVGHRGVGKSAFLRRVNVYRPTARCIDLRAEVSARAGLPLENLLREEGESGLLVHERTVLERLLEDIRPPEGHAPSPVYIELDPDFMAYDLPVFSSPDVEVLWVRRQRDRVGRIFLGHPRMRPEVPPLQEYQERAAFREKRFERVATRQLFLREGQQDISEEENSMVQGGAEFPDAVCLLSHFDLVREVLPMRAGHYLLRSGTQGVEAALQSGAGLSPERCILQVREAGDSVLALDRGWKQDLSVDITPAEAKAIAMVSLFDLGAGTDHQALLRQVETRAAARAPGVVLKVEAEIKDWVSLREMHQWRLTDPSRRVFLPLSKDGRWRWYHLLMHGRQPVSFIQNGDGAPDLPQVLEALRAKIRAAEFGFHLSESPMESPVPLLVDRWFREQGLTFLEGCAEPKELPDVLELLESLGVTRLSLAGSFQQWAHDLCAGRLSLRARRQGLVDTLLHGEQGWMGDCCGVSALRKVAREWRRRSGIRDPREPRALAYIGSSGGYAVVREEFPQAVHWQGRNQVEDDPFRPDLVIWDFDRESAGAHLELPSVWRPRWVLDLVDSEASPGREWAQRFGARHLAGDLFEKELSVERQAFWSESRSLLPALFKRKSSASLPE